jgi:hypothetical protein
MDGGRNHEPSSQDIRPLVDVLTQIPLFRVLDEEASRPRRGLA